MKQIEMSQKRGDSNRKTKQNKTNNLTWYALKIWICSTVNVWNWDTSVPISDVRLRDLCSKSGQPICPKLGQTKLGHFGKFLNIKLPRLVSQDFCPNFRLKNVFFMHAKLHAKQIGWPDSIQLMYRILKQMSNFFE